MATKVFTGGDGQVSQIAAAIVLQPADPVHIAPNMAPTVMPHFNNSLQIKYPTGTITESGTQVANRYSALDGMPVKHPPPVIKGQTVPMRDKENGFLSWAKNVWNEGGQMVMNGVKTGVNAIVTAIAPEAKQFMSNAEQVVTGLSMEDFKGAGQEMAEDVMAALQDPQTYIGLATTLAATAAQAIPVVGQIVGGAMAAQRVAGVAEAGQQAAQELSDIAGKWTQPMSPEQLADARQKLAKFLLGTGFSILMAVVGKKINLRRKKTAQKENSNQPVQVNTTGPPPKTSCACAIGRPVIIATGEKMMDETDFDLPGLIPLTWRRRYRSGDSEEGWFGQGWSVPLSVTLRLNADGLFYKDEQGRDIPLPQVELGKHHFDPYEKFTVHHPQPDQWMIEFKGGLRHWFKQSFASQWQLPLAVISDRNDNAIHLDWHASDDPFAPPRLDKIEDSAGRVLQLTWLELHSPQADGSLRVLQRLADVHLIAGPRGTAHVEPRLLAAYRYSDAGDLIASERMGLPYRQYAWRNHVLVAYRKASGHRYGVAYDVESSSGRVLRSWSIDDVPGVENPGTEIADHFKYEPEQRRTIHTDAIGRLTTYEFDARFDIVAITDPLGRRQAMPFDGSGNLTGITDALGRTTQYLFDKRGNLTGVMDPTGASSKIAYNALDLPIRITDALGATWTFSYDTRGNLISRTDPLEQTASYTHDARGLPATHTDAKGGIKKMAWDAAGQLIRYTDCSNQTTSFEYDVLGVQVEVEDAAGYVTKAEPDALGNIASILEPALPNTANAEHRFAYDGEGNLLTYTDPLGAITRYTYDGEGQPLMRLDAAGHTLRYEYDAARRLTALLNENGARYHFTYDAADNLIEEIGFDGRVQRYAYNAAGDLTHLIEAGGGDAGPGKITWFERDAMGRLIAKRHSDSFPDTQANLSSYHYDKLGRLIACENALAKTDFTYDAISQLLQETQTHIAAGRSFALNHRYDVLGNRIQTLLPALNGGPARQLNYLYYGSGHLHQINLATEVAPEQWQHHIVSDIERDALHREIQRSQGALSSRYDYDPMGRLVAHRVSAGKAAAQSVATQRGDAVAQTRLPSAAGLARQYAYDLAGNLTGTQDSLRGNASYQYDRLGRILAGVKANSAERFAFDPAGNLLDGQHAVGAVPDNRLTVHQDLRYAYDVHGNVVQRLQGWHTRQTYRYSPEHQLVEASITRYSEKPTERHNETAATAGTAFSERASTAQTWRYQYDALGRRIEKADAFGASAFFYDGDLLIAEQRGSKASFYLYEPDAFVPLAKVELVASTANVASKADERDYAVYYYQCDQIGAPQELTDEAGRMVWAASYKVWGETQPLQYLRTGTDDAPVQVFTPRSRSLRVADSSRAQDLALVDQPFRFQGQYFDPETGLHYNRFRYYDPVVGRFVHQDPIGLHGDFNFYQYAKNSGSWIDPHGLSVRKQLYPTRIRKPRQKQLEQQQRGNDGNIACAKCSCQLDTSNTSVQHEPALVETHNQLGYNTDQKTRNDLYNSTATSLVCLTCQKVEGGTMSHTHQYREDHGPNFKPRPTRKTKSAGGC